MLALELLYKNKLFFQLQDLCRCTLKAKALELVENNQKSVLLKFYVFSLLLSLWTQPSLPISCRLFEYLSRPLENDQNDNLNFLHRASSLLVCEVEQKDQAPCPSETAFIIGEILDKLQDSEQVQKEKEHLVSLCPNVEFDTYFKGLEVTVQASFMKFKNVPL